MSIKVAVIAGTKVDPQMGVDYLRRKDPQLEPHYFDVSPTPEEQHVFQYASMDVKRRILTALFGEAESRSGMPDPRLYAFSVFQGRTDKGHRPAADRSCGRHVRDAETMMSYAPFSRH